MSCSSTPHSTKIKGIAMTMPYQIIIIGALTKEETTIVQRSINEIFEETDIIYNRWNPNSEISRCNENSDHLLSQKLLSFFERIDEIYDLTDGYFDPTAYSQWIDPPVRWGWDLIILEKNKVTKQDMQLDLSGIAKGYAIDEIAKMLEELGYQNFLVDWAGDLFAKGSGYKKRGWTIEIYPTKNTIQLYDMAVATSSALMPKSAKDMETSHIVNAKEKVSLQVNNHKIIAVTVLAPKCLLADCLATAAASFTDLDKAKLWANEIQKEQSNLAFYFISENDVN